MRCYNQRRCCNSFVPMTCPFSCEESFESPTGDMMFPSTRMDVVEMGTQEIIMNRLVSLGANCEAMQELNHLMDVDHPYTFGEYREGNTIRVYFLKPEENGTYTLYVGQRENENNLC